MKKLLVTIPDNAVKDTFLPMHVRAHKVRLSRPYRIREGGFTVPRRDDYCPSACTADSACVENEKYVSRL